MTEKARHGRCGFLGACGIALALCGPLAAQSNVNAVAPAKPAAAPDAQACRRVHAFVSGRVQGVGFRAFTSGQVDALNLKVTGWVRNLPDGRVELVAEGAAADVERLMAAVAKGPAPARVDKVDREDGACTGEFKAFEVRQ